MATWKVYKKEENGDFYLTDNKLFDELLLLIHYEIGGKEVWEIDTPEAMLSALYDEYQVNEFMKDGDTIETPLGNFKCVSVHVVPE